jgi:hypothetical protein
MIEKLSLRPLADAIMIASYFSLKSPDEIDAYHKVFDHGVNLGATEAKSVAEFENPLRHFERKYGDYSLWPTFNAGYKYGYAAVRFNSVIAA